MNDSYIRLIYIYIYSFRFKYECVLIMYSSELPLGVVTVVRFNNEHVTNNEFNLAK